MEKLLGISLTEGVFIEYCDDEFIYMASDAFGVLHPFPIIYLDNILQYIIINKEPIDSFAEGALSLGYTIYDSKYWHDFKDVDIKIDDKFTITSITEDLSVIFNYDGYSDKFPICWLNNQIKEELNYSELPKERDVKRKQRIEEYEAFMKKNRSWSQKILDFIFK